MQLHNDFATHISELDNPIDRPYSAPIDTTLLTDNQKDVLYLNQEIAALNPDYMTFLPAYFWLFYFAVGWIYFTAFFFVNEVISDYKYFYSKDWIYFDVFMSIFEFIIMFGPLIILIYQLIRKHPVRTQYYFLKKQQKIAYYYRPLWKIKQTYELKIVDYKDVIPDLHQDKRNSAYTPLNLYVADDDGNITHHMKLEDYNVNPRVQWAFIRTYMESPSEDLPIDPHICQAYPADTTKSLFACSDIVFRKSFSLNTRHQGDGIIAMMFLGSAYVLGYLLQGNNYQAVKQAINHPKVKQLLTWDGQNNPYPIQPITEEAKQAFEGKNWQVNIRWWVAIAINAFFFIGFIMAYNG